MSLPLNRAARLLVGAMAFMLVVALAAPTPVAAQILGFDGWVITDDDDFQDVPAVWNGTTVWRDYRNGNYDIYRYDSTLVAPVPVCTATGEQYGPKVSDDHIVWRDARGVSFDIYGYDRATATEFPICTDPAAQHAPDLYERYVVWHDYRNGQSDIYGYDLYLDEEFPVCVAAGTQQYPAVWGDVFVWLDYRTNAAGDIWYWDASVGGPPSPLIMNASDKLWIDICQEWVLWCERDTDWDVKAYNLSTGVTKIVYSGPGDQRSPSIDGD